MSLLTQLNTLESTGLVRLAAAQPELEYLFRHALVQDAAYSSLLKRDRRQLHFVVGEALEQLYPDQRAEQAATLAYHFEQAEVRDKAIQYLTLAGDRAQDSYANAEAIAFYQAAAKQIEGVLRQTNESPEHWRAQLARVYESLADVAERTGQHPAAKEAYEQALGALTRLAQPTQIGQARLYRKIGFVLTVNRQHAEAHQSWDQGEQALGPPPAEQDMDEQAQTWWQEWIEIQVERAWNYYWQFQAAEIQAVCEKTQPVVERYGTPVQRARVLTVIAMAGFEQDHYLPSSQTVAKSHQALAAAHVAGGFQLIFDAQFYLGFVHLWRGEFDRAEEHLRPLREPAERMGDAIRLSRCVTYLMLLARMRHQVAETQRWIPRAKELAWAGKMTPYQYTAQACQAWVAWCAGNLTEARALASTALEYLQGPLANYPIKWPAYWPLLAVAFAEQNLIEACGYAQALLHPTQAHLPEALTASLKAAVTAREQAQPEEARTQLQQAINLAQEMGYL